MPVRQAEGVNESPLVALVESTAPRSRMSCPQFLLESISFCFSRLINQTVRLSPKPVDFRISIGGLDALMVLDIRFAVLYPKFLTFLKKPRHRERILYWEHNRFCLWPRRLESVHSSPSTDVTDEPIVVTFWAEPMMLVEHMLRTNLKGVIRRLGIGGPPEANS